MAVAGRARRKTSMRGETHLRFPRVRHAAARQEPRSVPPAGSELPGLDSHRPKPKQNKTKGAHKQALAHALPTFRIDDPRLAMIVSVWDRLGDEFKRRL